MDHKIEHTHDPQLQEAYQSDSPNHTIVNESPLVQHLLNHIGEQKYRLKWEQHARYQQELQLKAALQKQCSSLTDNRKLNAMLRNANYELSVLKSQLNPTNSEQTTQLNTVLHNEDTLIAANKKLLAENAELTATLEAKELQLSSEKIKAEQHIAQLKEDLSRADRELKRCQTHVFAITTINEMLIIGNEKRDDIIFEYKRKLQKFNNLSMSSDSESLSEDSSIVQAEQEAHKSLGEKAENCVEPCQGLPRNANASPIHLGTYAEFRRHLSEVEEETTDQYLCTLCGWRSSSEGDLKLHLFEKHEMESLSVMLDKCCLD